MKHLIINSENETLLNITETNSIKIKKVEVLGDENDVLALLNQIRFSKIFPNGFTDIGFISNDVYCSNTKKADKTDLEMNIEILDCNYTSLIIISTTSRKIEFKLIYE